MTAIYSFHVRIIRRSKGGSSVKTAAYIHRARIRDDRVGVTQNFQYKSAPDYAAILAPPDAPQWALNSSTLWNRVESCERRKDAQVAREFRMALPRILPRHEMIRLATEFTRNELVRLGMVADLVFHDLDSHNPHVHILCTMRRLSMDGFGRKVTEWNHKRMLLHWRKSWAEHCNYVLLRNGYTCTVDHRSLRAQNIRRHPQIHLGSAVKAMMQRGMLTDRALLFRQIKSINRKIKKLEKHAIRIKKQLNMVNDLLYFLNDPKAILEMTNLLTERRERLMKKLQLTAITEKRHRYKKQLHRIIRAIETLEKMAQSTPSITLDSPSCTPEIDKSQGPF